MMKKNLKIYGYIIGSRGHSIVFITHNRCLSSNMVNHGEVTGITLRKTMSTLLCFLLERKDEYITEDVEILKSVWESNDLRASSQRLWQVMNSIESKFRDVGLTETVFTRVRGKGYAVNSKIITPLFIECKDEYFL